MRLTKITIENFRCYKESTQIEFDSITALIGKNDAGKSTALEALDLFFNGKAPDSDDISVSHGSDLVRIACEFDDLPTKLVIDESNSTDLKAEYLVNSNERLEIEKTYTTAKVPKQKDIVALAKHPTESGYSDLLSCKNAQLKKKAQELNVDLTGINSGVNAELRQAIWKDATDLKLIPSRIPLKSEDAKEIWSQLQNYLPIYQLFKSDRPSTDQDEEAQDPMKLAVKQAVREQESALEDIVEKVKKSVANTADRTVRKIKEMDPGLASELNPSFNPPKWDAIFKISLTGEEDIPINKRGSGVRRLILLNFFRARAELASEKSAGVIYAVEEPETSQHPSNQRMLIKAFLELSQAANSQVLLTTHNPSLARLLPTKSIRMIERDDVGKRQILKGEKAARSAVDSLGVLPDHEIKIFVGVEGINDIEFLKRISKNLNADDPAIPNLQKLEDENQLVFIPVGGSNLSLWTTRLKELKIPELHIYDRDNMSPKQPSCQQELDEINSRENCKAYSTSKKMLENYLHKEAITDARPDVEIVFGDSDSVPEIAAKHICDTSKSKETIPWEQLEYKLKKQKISNTKKWLNREAVSKMNSKRLAESDPKGDIRLWLSQIEKAVTTGEL